MSFEFPLFKPIPERRGHLPPFVTLRAFEAIGRLGGIRRAADHLAVNQAVVSRHVRTLEMVTGVRLLHRSHKGVTLTPEGQRYYDRLSSAFSEILDATDELTGINHRTLIIWCAPGLAALWLMPILYEFEVENPDLTIVVRPTENVPDFMVDDVDVHIRYVMEPTCLNREMERWVTIAAPPVFPVAVPQIASKCRGLVTRIGQSDIPLIHKQNDIEWRNWFKSRGVAGLGSLGGATFWHTQLAIDAARQGRGIALTNSLLADEYLRTGELVELERLPGGGGPVLGRYLLLGSAKRWNAPHSLRFRRWIMRSAKAALTSGENLRARAYVA